MKTWTERMAQMDRQAIVPKTLVELYGTGRVLVEQHKGILGYGPEEILIGATYGFLRVRGTGLRLCCMSRSQLVISGEIHDVTMEGGC